MKNVCCFLFIFGFSFLSCISEADAQSVDLLSNDAVETVLPPENDSPEEKLNTAKANIEEGAYEAAIPVLENLIEQDPTYLEAWKELGRAYWETDRRDQSKALLERLLEIAPFEPMAYNLLAELATSEGDLNKSKTLYEKSLELNPDQYEVRVSYAQVMLSVGNRKQAVEMFKRLYQERPDRIDVKINLAWGLFADEQYEESLVHWIRINELFPADAGFLLAKANVYLLTGQLEEAETDARLALALEPENVNALQILLSLAIRADRPKETVDRLEEIYELAETLRSRINVAQQIAVYKQNVRNRNNEIFSQSDVVRAGKDAWELDLSNIDSAIFYGEALVKDTQYEDAEDVFQYVLSELNPNNERARNGLFESYMGRAMLDEAEDQLRNNLLNFNRANPFRHVFWARLHFARGDFPEAMRSLERLEYEGASGSVFTLKYRGISPSEWSDVPSVRQLRDHLMTLKRDGFSFITPSQLPLYFENKEAPSMPVERPGLNKVVEKVQYAWTGEKENKGMSLRDYSPDKVVMVTFDDGLRNSFRYGTNVGEEVGVPLTMFVGVGGVLADASRDAAGFREISEYMNSGVWEIQSQLWDAAEKAALDKEGNELGYRLSNRIWREDRNRKETLREYQMRIRKEFKESKEVLAAQLDLEPEDIDSVAYHYGELGQVGTTNIDLFNVTDVLMNESEIFYERGFINYNFGYAVKSDNPHLYKRYSPPRDASGRDVLRQAYLQHPVFVARKMRVEMAALSGQLHMAEENIDRLRRDGYPEEDLAELRAFVKRHLARLVRLPDSIEDVDEVGMVASEKVDFHDPTIGVDGSVTRANIVIDDEELGIFAGLNINPRYSLRVRGGAGSILQTLTTNRVVEVEETTTSSSNSTLTTILDGVSTSSQELRTTTQVTTIESNVVERFEFRADYTRVGLTLSYIHDSGAYTIVQGGFYTLEADGNPDFDEESVSDNAVTYGLEHQWRPWPAIDFSAVYHHGVVPSARELITFDQLAVMPLWRIRDGWHLNALGSFSYYEDDNSLLRGEIENFWRLSETYNVWLGLHNSLDTMDLENDLYWSPYFEQRHYLVFRLQRSYPNYFGMFKVNLGFQRSDVRDEVLDAFLNARAQGEAQGFSPGSGPDDGWNSLIGFSGVITRSWDSGWELTGEFTVNNTKEYTEHSLRGSILYKF